MIPEPLNLYNPTLVPALHRIQGQFGYLKPEALEAFSKETGVPLYRIQAVASFFPHFLLTPPKKIVLQVCRDQSCHLAGSGKLLRELGALNGEDVSIQGVSCLSRCDRAPAACLILRGSNEENYYVGRSLGQLKEIIGVAARGSPLPPSDYDRDLNYLTEESKIDPYRGSTPDYRAARAAIDQRDASLKAATKILSEKDGWNLEMAEEFRVAALRQGRADFEVRREVRSAVRCSQTDADWAHGPELGGWADRFFNEIRGADLRGLGGAGIPAAQKWKDVRDAVRNAWARQSDDRAFVIVNGDESEPGTFKDREILLRAPHLVVEAVILACLLTGASQGFIYIRHEYAEQIEACRAEILRAERMELCGDYALLVGRSLPISVFVSPGGYICGEQSALVEAMSDRRGEPRNMPPKLETNGLQNLPTLVSNVETFAWVPFILLHGPKAFAAEGANGWKGRRIFSVSGDVKRPGVYEVPMGTTLRELIFGEKYCRGMAGDKPLKALAPSGPSGGFLPAKLAVGRGLPREHTQNKEWQALATRRGFDPNSGELDLLDLELELNLFRALSPTQALGAGLVVYAADRDMAEQATNSVEFFRNESCGKCVPCRLGSQKLASVGGNLLRGELQAVKWNTEILPLIKEMGKAIELASICGLGRSVPIPLTTAAAFFAEDISKHLANGSIS